MLVADRVVISRGYLAKDIAEDTHEWCTSGKNTEEFHDKHMSQEFVNSRVIATVLLSWNHVEPLKNQDGKTIGTKLQWILHTNPNGNIPNMILNSMTGKSSVQALR